MGKFNGLAIACCIHSRPEHSYKPTRWVCQLEEIFEPEGVYFPCDEVEKCWIGADRTQEPDDIISREHKMIRRIKNCANAREIGLSDWEIARIKEWSRKGYYSDKQVEIIEKIYKRCPEVK